MPNGIALDPIDFTQWRAQQRGGYFTASRYRQNSHISSSITKTLRPSEKLMITLLYATFCDESTGAIRNFARFVLSEIWGNATWQNTPRL